MQAAAAWQSRQGEARAAPALAPEPHEPAHAAHLQPRGPPIHPSRQRTWDSQQHQQATHPRNGQQQQQRQPPAGRGGGAGARGPGGGGSGGAPAGAVAAPGRRSDVVSHEDWLRQARGEEAELSIDGGCAGRAGVQE